MIGIQLDDTTHDLKIRERGIAVGETTEQNQYLILATHRGEWKQYPSLGVGIGDYTNDNDTDFLRHSILENFRMDGLAVSSIKFAHGGIEITADYKQ
jgi:hypothetical protein